MTEKMLRPDEAATALNCSRKNIYWLLREGKLRGVKLSRRMIRIPESEIKALLEARRIN